MVCNRIPRLGDSYKCRKPIYVVDVKQFFDLLLFIFTTHIRMSVHLLTISTNTTPTLCWVLRNPFSVTSRIYFRCIRRKTKNTLSFSRSSSRKSWQLFCFPFRRLWHLFREVRPILLLVPSMRHEPTRWHGNMPSIYIHLVTFSLQIDSIPLDSYA